HLLAPVADGPSDELLVAEGAVHVRGVQEVDPQLDRAVDGGDRLLVVAAGVELAHPHAAEAHRGDLELTQFAAFHLSPPVAPDTMRTGRKRFKRMPGASRAIDERAKA